MTMTRQFPILAASVCVWRDGKVLLAKRKEGIWALPGGKVEPGETVAEAAARELLEETGIVANALRFVGLYEIIRNAPEGGLQMHYAIACHTGIWLRGEAVASSDADEIAWLFPEDVGKLSIAMHVKSAIESARLLINH
jgi:8-oxo-dGTP diphosphatase